MFLGLEIGSWADWVSGVGTIIAIVVSLFVLFYQIKTSKRVNFEQNMLDRNNDSLDKAEILAANSISDLDDILQNLKNSQSKKTQELYLARIDKARLVVNDIKRNLTIISVMLSRFDDYKYNGSNIISIQTDVVNVIHPLKELITMLEVKERHFERIKDQINTVIDCYQTMNLDIRKIRTNINSISE